MNDTVAAHYSRAVDLAVRKIERMARRLLREHDELDEFVMAMGLWTFSAKCDPQNVNVCPPGGSLSGNDIEREYLRPLDKFISEWDEYLKITGTPMRFTAKGPKRMNW